MDDLLADIAAELENSFEEVPSSNETKNDEAKAGPSSSNVHSAKSVPKTGSLLVSPLQRGNPLLKAISKVPWEFFDIVPDYEMGKNMCALFLSLRYHNLNPDYIHDRLKKLGKMYELRVLLVQVDIKDPHHILKNLTRICILADITLILAWSAEEAGKILETYKIYENKPADTLMENSREKDDVTSHLKLIQALTSVRSVNKTDAMTLLSKFKTLEGIIKASEYQLSECPGFSTRKAKKLHSVLHEKFCR